MPIVYNYEGPLAAPAYNQSVQAGYGLGLASARRFSAGQQMEANKMLQQQAMQMQQMYQQRWMQQQDNANSLDRIQMQGGINQRLQEAGNQNRMELQQNQFDLRGQEQEKYYDLKRQYDQDVMKLELDSVGEKQRRELEARRDRLKEAWSSGMVDEPTYKVMDAQLMSDGLGLELPSKVRKPPDGTMQFEANGQTLQLNKDDTITNLGPTVKTIDQLKLEGRITEVDLPGGGKAIDVLDNNNRLSRTVTVQPYAQQQAEIKVAQINMANQKMAMDMFETNNKARIAAIEANQMAQQMAKETETAYEPVAVPPMRTLEEFQAMIPRVTEEVFGGTAREQVRFDPNTHQPLPPLLGAQRTQAQAPPAQTPPPQRPPMTNEQASQVLSNMPAPPYTVSEKEKALSPVERLHYATLPHPRTKQEWESLNPGVQWVDPDGNLNTK